MQELKFRIWDKKSKVFRHLLERGFIEGHGYARLTNLCSIDRENSRITSQEEGRLEFLLFTGLFDVNGREIYEGDIVRIYHPAGAVTCYVKFYSDRNYPAFDIYPPMNVEFNFLQYAVEEEIIEVIGNIYQNPELLKKEGRAKND